MTRDELVERLARAEAAGESAVPWDGYRPDVQRAVRKNIERDVIPEVVAFVAEWLDENEALIAEDERTLTDAADLWREEMGNG